MRQKVVAESSKLVVSSMASRWRAEDLLDLERCGLAAELASTNLGSSGSGTGWGQGMQENDITYDFR